MINRVFIKELLSFKSIDLEFNSSGLIVITGPSGAGKSVFINSILANFGLANQEAKVCEVELLKPKGLESEDFELEDEIVIKAIKKDRVRFLIDGQSISKKRLKELFSSYLSYISVRDKSGFENEKLIEIIDNFIIKNNQDYQELLDKYDKEYNLFVKKQKELNLIEQKIKESNQRVEFLKFEIEKIEKIAPKEGEYEELLVVKKQLSKIDKIQELASRAQEIFNYEDTIYELFSLLNKDSSYFSDAMNQLRSDFEEVEALKEELEDIDIETLLNRLEELSSLIKRFGTIKEALEYLEEKKKELESFEFIEQDLTNLKEFLNSSKAKLEKLALKISSQRKSATKELEQELSSYLKDLKLPNIKFNFTTEQLYELGIDRVEISMQDTKIESLSGGEFNRVRLALLSVAASRAKANQGVIILDEIDANVSGDESIAIANMISKLSKSFQIFAISHQPHLSSKADTHILVSKKDNQSYAQILDKEQRVKEIARIIGGENFSKEAIDFAKKLI